MFWLTVLTGCDTGYQPQSFTGGYSEFLTAPDEAVITFRGNGYTSGEKVGEMAALRAADVTLQHGFRYFVVTGVSDVSRGTSFTTAGYAQTFGSAYGVGNYATGHATTVITPPQTFNIHKPGIMLAINMSNDEKSLNGIGAVIFGHPATPKDAAFLSNS